MNTSDYALLIFILLFAINWITIILSFNLSEAYRDKALAIKNNKRLTLRLAHLNAVKRHLSRSQTHIYERTQSPEMLMIYKKESEEL